MRLGFINQRGTLATGDSWRCVIAQMGSVHAKTARDAERWSVSE